MIDNEQTKSVIDAKASNNWHRQNHTSNTSFKLTSSGTPNKKLLSCMKRQIFKVIFVTTPFKFLVLQKCLLFYQINLTFSLTDLLTGLNAINLGDDSIITLL